MSDFNYICDTVKGGTGLIELVNKGFNKTKAPWNIVIVAGGWLNNRIKRHFDLFCQDKNDIIFPVENGNFNFVETSLHGMIIHKDTFVNVGNFQIDPVWATEVEAPSIEIAKLGWCLAALNLDSKFKPIVGMKINNK